MSRLDDELRNAFRREQPPVDFTARVLERVARQPQPNAGWRQRLAGFFQPPKLRWVAISVTASLLLALGAAQYSRLGTKVMDGSDKLSQTTPPPDEHKSASNSSVNDSTPGVTKAEPRRPPKTKHIGAALSRVELAAARLRREQELRAEAEAAKEKLMLALSIASAALNDAQKAVHDDGPRP